MSGRVVGVDLSSVACSEARGHCESLGPRAQIIQADFLSLSAADLGTFDLIYLAGTIYVVPDPVRDHLLDLVAGCLRPGGVAMIGYYSGLTSSAKAHIYRIIRSMIPEGLAPAEAVGQVRAILADMRGRVGSSCASIDAALQQAWSLTDLELFHEALNPAFAPLHTVAIESRLATAGIQFLTFVEANSCGRSSSSRQRAVESELLDLAGGAYRRALFGRPMQGAGTGSLFESGATWWCALTRTSAPDDYGSPGLYRQAGSPIDVKVHEPAAQAVVDEMIAQPAALPDLALKARVRLERAGFTTSAIDQSSLESILGQMWDYRLIMPMA